MTRDNRKPLPVIADCTDCGACCTGQAALPVHMVGHMAGQAGFSTPVTPLPDALRDELKATLERFLRDGFPADDTPCIWYDPAAKQCRHYEHRPELCRDEVLPGDDGCRRWRLTRGIDPTPKLRLVGGKVVRS